MDLKNVGRLCALFVCVLLGASGCANKPSWQTKYDRAMNDARAKEDSEKYQKAKKSYLKATEINPTRAEPWVHLATIEFFHGNYGEAIVMAGEALDREPSNRRSKEEAEAILVASGLRATISGLERLHNGSRLQGSTKDDARELAEKMRAVLGEDVVTFEVKAPQPKKSPAARRAVTNPKKAAAKPKGAPSQEGATNYSNPFEFLPQN